MKKHYVWMSIVVLGLDVSAAHAQKDPMVGAEMFPTKNIVENAMNSQDHTTLVAAVKTAGLVDTLGGVLPALGVKRGAVVHGTNGLDEVAGDVPTLVHSFGPDGARTWQLDPGSVGVNVPLAEIVGGSVEACRVAFFSVLGGERSPASNVVALNAAVVLHAIGRQDRLGDAFEQASEVLRSGAALRTFERAKELAVDA